MNPLLVTMRGPGDPVTLAELSNFEAGVIAIADINRLYPGITWGQMAALARGDGAEAMGRSWWRRAGHAVASAGRGTVGAGMDVVRGAGEVVMDVGRAGGGVVMDVGRGSGSLIGDAFDATGDKIGDAVRLFTSDHVVDGVNKAWKGWTDGGGVAGFWGTSQMFGGTSGGTDGEEESAAGGIWDFITNLGAGVKKKGAAEASILGMPASVLPWAIAGGAVLVILFAKPGAHK